MFWKKVCLRNKKLFENMQISTRISAFYGINPHSSGIAPRVGNLPVFFVSLYIFMKKKDMVILMLLFSESLQDVFRKVEWKFTPSTALYIIAQTLKAIHNLHLRNYIHCEISPSNISNPKFLWNQSINCVRIYVLCFHLFLYGKMFCEYFT